jgi:fumarylacetoacetate (FAA) hydrolase
MKLASLNKGRDGQLIVVSKDLATYAKASHIALTMQNAIENWEDVLPKLQSLYKGLNNGNVESHPFNVADVASPLPRAYQWLDGSAYVKHVELVRKARGAELPESFWQDPLMYQGGSDTFLAPTGDIPFVDNTWGLDYEAEVTVVTDDVPLGTKAENMAEHIKLIMLVNDVSLRGLTKDELAKGFGFMQSKPSSAFSPVAVTPDELSDSWNDGKVNLPLYSYINGEEYGRPNAGIDMVFNFYQLIEHAAKSRNLGAGTIVGSGTIANLSDDVSKGTNVGSSCLAERRMLETIIGKPVTPWMQPEDSIRIEMLDDKGSNIFGSIEQTVKQI